MTHTSRSIAIVTGGSRGIGAAAAVALATHGYDVCVAYRRDAAAADRVADAVRQQQQQAITRQADVASEQDVMRLFDACASELGPVSALVNSAGIVADKARVDETSVERFTHLLQVNVIGTFLCCREAVKCMSTRYGGEGGSIVNVSSVASRIGSPGEYVDYAASKGAVDSFSLGLAKEVALEGIRVNVVPRVQY
jgi:NAD(P)-dependent dehydrogenase (short-subunit alcohol dehydrogenase family)